MEVVRDRADNAIIICSIENVDPMGIHTGDSITVAPALTLTDKEYQIMRNASIACLREIGVETGGSNVQFAVNPEDGRLVVIEMNPRVSPLLGAGLQGDRLPDRQGRGQAGGRLHARRDPERHHRRHAGQLRADDRLCRHQDPALRLREVQGRGGAAVDRDEVGRRGDGDRPQLPRKPAEGAARPRDRADRPRRRQGALRRAAGSRSRRRWPGRRPDRLLVAAQALREGFTVDEIHAITKYDPWFLERITEIVDGRGGDLPRRPAPRRRRACAG